MISLARFVCVVWCGSVVWLCFGCLAQVRYRWFVGLAYVLELGGLRVIVLSGFWFGLFAGFGACRYSVFAWVLLLAWLVVVD